MAPRPALRFTALAALAVLSALPSLACGPSSDDAGRGTKADAAEDSSVALGADELERLDPLLAEAVREELARLGQAADADRPAALRSLAELYLANGLNPAAERAYAAALRYEARFAPQDAAKLWYGRATAALRDGRSEDAIGHGERAAELAPSYAPLLWRLGEWRFASGELEAARADYQRAIAAQPQHVGGHLGLARVHLQKGEHDAAAQILATKVLGGPSDGYGRMLLARAMQGLGRDDDARTLSSQSRGAQPVVADPWLSEILQREISRHAQLNRAFSLVRAGRTDEAIALLEPLVAAEPDNVTALSNLASTLFLVGRLDEASKHVQRAQELDPGGYRPVFTQGQIEARRGRTADAIATMRRALALNPAPADVNNALGALLASTGDREGALDAFRAGLRYAPDDLQLLGNAATLARGLDRLEDAKTDYERWLSLAPSHRDRPKMLIGLADVRLRLGDAPGALQILEPFVPALEQKLGPLDPLVVDARVRLVEALELVGRADEAAEQRKRLR